MKLIITVKFDNLNASFPNKCITFFQKIADFGNVDYVIEFDALIQFSVSEEHYGNAPVQYLYSLKFDLRVNVIQNKYVDVPVLSTQEAYI